MLISLNQIKDLPDVTGASDYFKLNLRCLFKILATKEWDRPLHADNFVRMGSLRFALELVAMIPGLERKCAAFHVFCLEPVIETVDDNENAKMCYRTLCRYAEGIATEEEFEAARRLSDFITGPCEDAAQDCVQAAVVAAFMKPEELQRMKAFSDPESCLSGMTTEAMCLAACELEKYQEPEYLKVLWDRTKTDEEAHQRAKFTSIFMHPNPPRPPQLKLAI